MERKYRQRGYQSDSEREPRKSAKPPSTEREGPKSPKMMTYQGIMRCGMCGTEIQLDGLGFTAGSQCPKCKADLRTCRNCVSFDPSARFECRANVSTRIANKTKENACTEFAPRRTVEKRTGESRQTSTGENRDDPRAAFEKLFKK